MTTSSASTSMPQPSELMFLHPSAAIDLMEPTEADPTDGPLLQGYLIRPEVSAATICGMLLKHSLYLRTRPEHRAISYHAS
ncbi:hypothetical protein HNR39_002622 [Glaciimonas immobilis]|uniref:Uncharacterized protein n=1 Tax=Glaciimonas immobilis TaxID=728004 RepID=A0A840RWE2_9BURK|nr:hypothetical protein [Glaciimonas immobilis]